MNEEAMSESSTSYHDVAAQKRRQKNKKKKQRQKEKKQLQQVAPQLQGKRNRDEEPIN